MTRTETVIRAHLTKAYGDSAFARGVIGDLAPLLAAMVERGEPRRDVGNLIWMNFSGGDTATSVVDAIYADLDNQPASR